MPIKIPASLPAAQILESEHIFVMDSDRAYRQDIRPIRILILNLMPNKTVTETQLLRLLGNTPLQVEVDFIYTESYLPKHTSIQYLSQFYGTFEDVKDKFYDGFIITGAPVERMEYEEVAYWKEVCEIMDWSREHVWSTFHVCWGAYAGLYHHYGIRKYYKRKKVFGVFKHHLNVQNEKLFRGFDDEFYVPHSRHIGLNRDDLDEVEDLSVMAEGDAGVYIVANRKEREFYITGHAEYDPYSLKSEYDRDVKAGMDIDIPQNYYPDDDPTKEPVVRWRSVANLLFANWLNYYVYQETPYDIDNMKKAPRVKGKLRKKHKFIQIDDNDYSI